MNIFAEKLGLTSTYFDSPHGLMNKDNMSCAFDMSKLSAIVMQNNIIRKIVLAKNYRCEARSKYQTVDTSPPSKKLAKLRAL